MNPPLLLSITREVGHSWFLSYISMLRLAVGPGHIQYDYFNTLRMSLNPEFGYFVNFYDSKYSLVCSNPKTVPRISLNLGNYTGHVQVYIEVSRKSLYW